MTIKAKPLKWIYREHLDAFEGHGVFGVYATVYIGKEPDDRINADKKFWDESYKRIILSQVETTPTPSIEITDEMVERAVPFYAQGGCIGLDEYEVKEAIRSILYEALNNKA